MAKVGGVCGEVPRLYYIFYDSMDIDATTADRNSCVPDPIRSESQQLWISTGSRSKIWDDVVAVNVIDDIVQHVLVIEGLFVSVIVHYSPYDLAVRVAFGVCD